MAREEGTLDQGLETVVIERTGRRVRRDIDDRCAGLGWRAGGRRSVLRCSARSKKRGLWRDPWRRGESALQAALALASARRIAGRRHEAVHVACPARPPSVPDGAPIQRPQKQIPLGSLRDPKGIWWRRGLSRPASLLALQDGHQSIHQPIHHTHHPRQQFERASRKHTTSDAWAGLRGPPGDQDICRNSTHRW
jgi:hypothetical protein